MIYPKKLRGALATMALALITCALSAPASSAERISLSDLQQRIQALESRLDTLSANPCPEGKAIVAVQSDGTPVCASFAPTPTVEFSFDFVQGNPGIADAVAQACPAWQTFVSDAADRSGSITVSGSDGAPRTCSDPAKVAEILTAMNDAASGPIVDGNRAVIQYGGFNSSLSNFCASTANNAPGAPQVELKVSPDTDPVPGACACQSAAEGVYVVRPCIGNQNWGGVGTNVCNGPSQTISVTAQ